MQKQYERMFEDVEFWRYDQQYTLGDPVGPHRPDCWFSLLEGHRSFFFNPFTGEIPGVARVGEPGAMEIRRKIKPISLSYIGLDN